MKTSKSIEQRRAEVLLNAIQFYAADPSGRRAVDSEGLCEYWVDGRMCAVGRECGERIAKGLLNEDPWWFSSVRESGNPDGYTLYPDHVSELGTKFLSEFQALHDYAHNWNATGLSEKGQELALDIDTLYCDSILQKSFGR